LGVAEGPAHFGTILVDLARGWVIELLLTRAAAVATWLAARPITETISRDRQGPYGEGFAAARHAPADRFRLVINLRDRAAAAVGAAASLSGVPHRAPPTVIAHGTRLVRIANLGCAQRLFTIEQGGSIDIGHTHAQEQPCKRPVGQHWQSLSQRCVP
jgi:hypothetical protein